MEESGCFWWTQFDSRRDPRMPDDSFALRKKFAHRIAHDSRPRPRWKKAQRMRTAAISSDSTGHLRKPWNAILRTWPLDISCNETPGRRNETWAAGNEKGTTSPPIFMYTHVHVRFQAPPRAVFSGGSCTSICISRDAANVDLDPGRHDEERPSQGIDAGIGDEYCVVLSATPEPFWACSRPARWW
jgi:hypothetical protein